MQWRVYGISANASSGVDIFSELINAEDRFTYVRDALKTLTKMDFDKLIAAVKISSTAVISVHSISTTFPAWIL